MDIVRNQKVFEKELEELADDGYDSAEDDFKYFESKVDLLYPNKWARLRNPCVLSATRENCLPPNQSGAN